MMAGVEVTAVATPSLQPVGEVIAAAVTVTGAVGIAGALSAVMSVRCSAQCATKIASRMLGIPPAEAAGQKCDAIGEICNMVAGNFKAKIGLEDQCMLSVPTVISGGSYQVHATSATQRVQIRLLCEEEVVSIALEVRG